MMRFSRRFLLDLLFVVGGATVAVVAMAFTAHIAGWIGFGVFTGVAVLALVSAIMTRRTPQKVGHGLIAAVGLWSLIAALIFTGSALTWLVFAGGIALGVVALADLTAHEAVTENVVHRLEVTSTPAARAETSDRTTA